MTELPPPPDCSFASDNAAGVSPRVLDAIVAANTPSALAYGEDRWTEQAVGMFHELFGAPVEVRWCWGGTGANVVGLASMLQPFQAVICTDQAHIYVDECGAPTRITGCPLLPVAHDDGKLHPAAIEHFAGWQGSEHHPQPAVVSISQVTEYGTVYSADEIAALADAAHRLGMHLHLDGARIANAVVASGTDVRTMLVDTGVDVLTFGATKNGAMYGEAVVYLRPELAANAGYLRKQAGQLPSKARFVAAQMIALLTDDLWLDNARQANAMAALLAAEAATIPGVRIPIAPQANAVFAELPAARIAELQRWSFFWEWDLAASLVRWMASFVTTTDDVHRFVAGIRSILTDPLPDRT